MIDIYKIILFSSLVISLQAKIFSVLPLHNWTAQGILVLRARVPCRGVYLAAWNGSGMKERKSTWSAKANQALFTKNGGDGGIRTHVPFYRQLDFETHSPFVLWQNIEPLKRTCWKLGNVEYSRTILKFNPNYVLKSRNPSNFNVFE